MCDEEGTIFPPVPLMRDNSIVEQPVNYTTVTPRYTAEALSILDTFAESGLPFFLHIGYEQPHVPLFASPEFLGKSRRGLYGDCVEEMDASIDQILQKLAQTGLAENTLVVFTSDVSFGARFALLCCGSCRALWGVYLCCLRVFRTAHGSTRITAFPALPLSRCTAAVTRRFKTAKAALGKAVCVRRVCVLLPSALNNFLIPHSSLLVHALPSPSLFLTSAIMWWPGHIAPGTSKRYTVCMPPSRHRSVLCVCVL
jgi:hypothetical protein